MSVKYEPASEPLHISVKQLIFGAGFARRLFADGIQDAQAWQAARVDRVGAEAVALPEY